MLLGLSYQKAARLWREFYPNLDCPGKRGIHLDEMDEFLCQESPWSKWEAEDFEKADLLEEWDAPAPLNAILTWQGRGYQGHWVAHCHGIVYDPHHDGPRLAKDCLRASHRVVGGLFL